MDKFEELESKLIEVDRLVGDILDSEPAPARGEYGRKIADLCRKLDWIDFCCVVDHED